MKLYSLAAGVLSCMTLSMILISCSFCGERTGIHKRSSFISLAGSIEFIPGSQTLDKSVTAQIDPKSPKFAEEDYIVYSDNRYFPGLKELAQQSTLDALNIFIDYRLLNQITLVLTERNSDSIIGYIKQNKYVDQPSGEYAYFIPHEEVVRHFGSGPHDIYGFRNDTLLFKNEWPFPAERIPRPEK